MMEATQNPLSEICPHIAQRQGYEKTTGAVNVVCEILP